MEDLNKDIEEEAKQLAKMKTQKPNRKAMKAGSTDNGMQRYQEKEYRRAGRGGECVSILQVESRDDEQNTNSNMVMVTDQDALNERQMRTIDHGEQDFDTHSE